MRWRRAATVGMTAFALLVIARPAGAVTYVGLHDLTCEGATTEGTGMPEGQRLEVALVDPASTGIVATITIIVTRCETVLPLMLPEISCTILCRK